MTLAVSIPEKVFDSIQTSPFRAPAVEKVFAETIPNIFKQGTAEIRL